MNGLILACRKRPVAPDRLDELVDRVEGRLAALRDSEVQSQVVGRLLMDELGEVDAVAYVRFASVYEAFESVEQFVETIRPLRDQ